MIPSALKSRVYPQTMELPRPNIVVAKLMTDIIPPMIICTKLLPQIQNRHPIYTLRRLKCYRTNWDSTIWGINKNS